MLISLRNSGATGIDFYKYVEPHQLMEMITVDEEFRDEVHSILLRPIKVEAFVVDKNKKIHNLLLTKREFMGNDAVYEIIIETDYGRYRLWYGEEKPDFYKRLFKYFYPEEAENQVEELV